MPWLVLGNSHLSEFGCTVLLWCSMGVYWFQVCSLRHLEPQLFFFVLIHAIKLCVFMVLLLLTKEKLRVFFRLRFLTGKYKKRNRNEGLDFISVCSMAKASVKWNLSGQYSFNLTTKLSSVWPCVFCTRWDGVLQSAASCSANLWLISEEVCPTRCVRGGPLQNTTRRCAAKMVSVCKSTKVLKELGT